MEPATASTHVTDEAPTKAPTEVPTEAPTRAPTKSPTEAPTDAPTEAPTKTPTEGPTEESTEESTKAPTEEEPTGEPAKATTRAPTEVPTEASTSTQAEASTSKPLRGMDSKAEAEEQLRKALQSDMAEDADRSEADEAQVKRLWMAQVITDEEAEAKAQNDGTDNRTMAVRLAERRWVRHLLHELEQEVSRGTALSQEDLEKEVKWIHETAKQMVRDGVLQVHRQNSHPDAKKVQA